MPKAIHIKTKRVVEYMDHERFDHYFFSESKNLFVDRCITATMITTNNSEPSKDNIYTFVNHDMEVTNLKQNEVIFEHDNQFFVVTKEQFKKAFERKVV